MSVKKQIIPIITGPTASGKSSFALDLADAMGNSAIVGADSMQVYKHLDIGTAKATLTDRTRTPHYLIDFLELDQKFAVTDYQKLAASTVDQLLDENIHPIVCGGTPQYVTSLVEGTKFMPSSTDPELRARLETRIEEEGSANLLEELSKYDPEKAAELHPNNKRRIVRALEIAILTEHKQSDWDEEAQTIEFPFEVKVFMFNWPREDLYKRINTRVDQMLEDGILDEARYLFNLDLAPDTTSLQAIGYKEFFPYFRGEITLDEAVEDLKKYSRRYAKRQLTWFRHKDWVNYLEVDAANNIDIVLKAINAF